MPTDAPAADSNFLTIDQAVANLDEADKPEKAPAVAEATPETEIEAEPTAETADEPETVIEGETAETEEAEQAETPELPAINPPHFWDAEGKKLFSELPRPLQELVLSKETERDKATSRAIEAAALKGKAAEGEASKFSAYTARLDKLVPEAEQAFAGRWGEGEIDWNRVAQEQGVETAFTLKNNHDREKLVLQSLKDEQQKVTAENTQKFVAERLVKLQKSCPDLVDPKLGNDRQLQLVKFWADQGKDTKVIIERADDLELGLLYDAMRWRQAQASASAKAASPQTQARPAAQTPRPTVRATAAPGRSASPQSSRINELNRKTSLTTDELVELLDLQG